MTLLIACIILSLCLGHSSSAVGAVATSALSAKSFNSVSAVLSASHTAPSSQATGQSSAATLAATLTEASSSTSLSVAELSQAAAAASSQALAEAPNSTNAGSEVGILGQVIIAIGVLPVEILIVTIVLGIHRLVHRRKSRPLQTRADSTKHIQQSLPYLQPKAELEDEQRRKHELNGEHVVHELDGEDKIFQMPDETENLVLPLQGRRGIQEMPEGNHMSWEMPLQEIYEALGDELAQELGCPARGREESIGAENHRELESPVQARDESVRVRNAQDLAPSSQDPTKDSAHVNPGRSHFMLRQQQMLDSDDPMDGNQFDASESYDLKCYS